MGLTVTAIQRRAALIVFLHILWAIITEQCSQMETRRTSLGGVAALLSHVELTGVSRRKAIANRNDAGTTRMVNCKQMFVSLSSLII